MTLFLYKRNTASRQEMEDEGGETTYRIRAKAPVIWASKTSVLWYVSESDLFGAAYRVGYEEDRDWLRDVYQTNRDRMIDYYICTLPTKMRPSAPSLAQRHSSTGTTSAVSGTEAEPLRNSCSTLRSLCL
ncbi:hypothetical protein PILCRDRAFT_258002 [Piloderma croceum F 1598]|uniref:Uncharacterized protein n=1 Tax=Piloderma croceum (strain F 1598) TaxID=765440 RepID=A0A0C3FVJ0_PILCF|nr:hypothetical protein PILCRDRAFT_258002 [Piloderma croceum F 1598]